MLLLKYLLMTIGYWMFVSAATIMIYSLYRYIQYRRQYAASTPETRPDEPKLGWERPKKLALLGWVPLLASMAIVVVPAGMGGVRVSQLSGTLPGTLYPGVHFVMPLIHHVVMYDIRDQVLTTAAIPTGAPIVASKDKDTKAEPFSVTARDGLTVGLAITVRYRLDAGKLAYIHSNLPQPVEEEIVPPVVASVFREVIPNYTVREIFAARREEIRNAAAEKITQKLSKDGIVVKEVMMRDIKLPAEYAKGLEGLLLKEQQNEGLNIETEIKEKQVRIAELEAEAAKVREVKNAEGNAQVRVLQAKSEADSMLYTLPLKEKQIQQSRLEAEARKEATVKNAEAQAQAKVIDSKAEMERRNLLADAEAKRIRVIALADGERMKSEAGLLKQNPLLINKIIAERLSDKLQIMMVPSDGKFFFNDVLKNSTPASMAAQAEDAEEEDNSGNEYASPQHYRGQR